MRDALGAVTIHPFDLLDCVYAADRLCFSKEDNPLRRRSITLQTALHIHFGLYLV